MAAVALDACGGAQSDLVGKFTCAICLGVLVRARPEVKSVVRACLAADARQRTACCSRCR
jgi:hypothetical protein